MSFKISRRPTVGFPIEAGVYNESGDIVAIKFTVIYQRANKKELKNLQEQLSTLRTQRWALDSKEMSVEESAWPYKTDEAFFEAKIAGWSGISDAEGEPIPFSKEALADLVLDYPELSVPLFEGFFAAHQGARLKN